MQTDQGQVALRLWRAESSSGVTLCLSGLCCATASITASWQLWPPQLPLNSYHSCCRCGILEDLLELLGGAEIEHPHMHQEISQGRVSPGAQLHAACSWLSATLRVNTLRLHVHGLGLFMTEHDFGQLTRSIAALTSLTSETTLITPSYYEQKKQSKACISDQEPRMDLCDAACKHSIICIYHFAAGSAAGPLQRLHALFNDHAEVQQRHLAFMLISLLGGEPGTLYRASEDHEGEEVEGGSALHACSHSWPAAYCLCQAMVGLNTTSGPSVDVLSCMLSPLKDTTLTELAVLAPQPDRRCLLSMWSCGCLHVEGAQRSWLFNESC